MKRLALALLTFAAAITAHAQSTATAPDVDRLPLSIWAEPEKHEVAKLPGMATFTINNWTIHIPYIPIVRPFPGSVPGRTSVIPTAFELLNVSFPYRSTPVDPVQQLAEKLAAEARQ